MGLDEVVINEEALMMVGNSVAKYANDFRNAIVLAISNINSSSSDWNDEDFDNLIKAIKSFLSDCEGVDAATSQVIERVKEKLSLIQRLHSMEIY